MDGHHKSAVLWKDDVVHLAWKRPKSSWGYLVDHPVSLSPDPVQGGLRFSGTSLDVVFCALHNPPPPSMEQAQVRVRQGAYRVRQFSTIVYIVDSIQK